MMRRTIRLLGEPEILDAAGRAQAVRGQQAWAVLARVLLSRRPVERRTLAAELFAEAADPLGALRWCLAALRKALDTSECLRGDPIACDLPEDIAVDVLRLEAASLCDAGPLLGGMEPRGSAEFATWLLVERARLAGLVEAGLRREAVRAMAAGEHEAAIRAAEACVRQAPFEEGGHVLLVRALSLAGRHAAAVAHVAATEAAFVAEVGEAPSPALRSAARRSPAAPPGGISRTAVIETAIRSGLAALAAGAADAGIECLRRAASDAERLRDGAMRARATLELGTALVHAVRGFDEEGAVLLRQSAALAEAAGMSAVAARAWRELGYVEALAGRRPAAAGYLAQALAAAEDAETLSGIAAVTGFNLVDWGRTDAGIAQFRLALEQARTAGNTRREIWALGIGARGLLAAERAAEAEDWLARCLSLIDAQNWVAFRPWPMALRAEAALRRGARPGGLRAGMEEAFALACHLGDPCWEAASARMLALGDAASGDFTAAAGWLAEARGRCFRTTDAYVAVGVDIAGDQARIAARLGRDAEADARARDWIALAARAHMDGAVAAAAGFLGRK